MAITATASCSHNELNSDIAPCPKGANIGSHCSSFRYGGISPSATCNLGHPRCPIRTFARSILVASLLNLRKVPVTHTKWTWGTGGGSDDEASNDYWVRGCRSARSRRNRRHYAVALALDRRHCLSADTTLLKGLTVDANKLPTADFDDRWSAMFAFDNGHGSARARRPLSSKRSLRSEYEKLGIVRIGTRSLRTSELCVRLYLRKRGIS